MAEPDPPWLEELRAALGKARVVSCDIFDTALVRGVARPEDVHLITGARARAAGLIGLDPAAYREVRIEAERVARAAALAAGHDEPSLAEIHAHLARCGITANAQATARLAGMECEAERAVLRPVLALRDALAARAEGQTLVFTSDTVLPGSFLSRLLAEHGFGANPTVFTSADARRSKHTGRLYAHVAQALGVATAEILHIGDNPQTDIANARTAGARALHLPRAKPAPEPAETARLHWAARLLRSQRRAGPAKPGLHRFATLLLLGFTLFTLEQARARGIGRVYYLSRDGYFPFAIAQRIIARRGWDIEARYLRCSRQSVVLPAMAGDLPALARRLADSMLDQPFSRALEAIGIGAAETSAMLRGIGVDPAGRARGAAGMAAMEQLFAANAERIGSQLAALRADALAYLEQEDFLRPGPRLVVDVGWRGSTQTALAALTGLPAADIVGAYLGLFADALRPGLNPANTAGYLFNFGHPAPRHDLAREGYALFELFCSAPHATIARYRRDGATILAEEAAEADPRRAAALAALEEGVMAEIDALDAVLDGAWPEQMDADSALADMLALLRAPARADVRAVNAIPFINTLNGAHCVPAINPLPFRRLVLDLEGGLRQLRNSPWRAGAVRLALPWPLPCPDFATLEDRARRAGALLKRLDPRAWRAPNRTAGRG